MGEQKDPERRIEAGDELLGKCGEDCTLACAITVARSSQRTGVKACEKERSAHRPTSPYLTPFLSLRWLEARRSFSPTEIVRSLMSTSVVVSRVAAWKRDCWALHLIKLAAEEDEAAVAAAAAAFLAATFLRTILVEVKRRAAKEQAKRARGGVDSVQMSMAFAGQ